ncbi:DUF924 family protein [Rhizobium rosettiformans]|uniref:DUF924 family protein n=1 Tax=Rhizobium rosettiformans TaxID=1368430 RepID=UPI00285DA476|nr:DUF924 family protein [Rhizobium rosettiformans]MDR7030406.1 uncharacterized protein (DUF924 family) [Rhizobium rosettiformans]MDR7065612.1 uncharacterized protein (DUF924 family) [Rhizobium rosettiformans]
MSSPHDVIECWLRHGPEAWFSRNEALDAEIEADYADLHFKASRCELSDWEETPEGTLALLLLLDQFPRNLFRGSAHSYATDPLARTTAHRALAKGFDKRVEPVLRPFFYLPFEHSEEMEDQKFSVSLFEKHRDETGDAEPLKWAIVHLELIERFGRFPHRNAALGRQTTAEEQAYLDDDGFKG